MTYTITVTQQDIDTGCPEDGDNCPVAHAARRLFPNLSPEAGDTLLRFYDFTSERLDVPVYKGQLPNVARAFIGDFDSGCQVQPFEFKIFLKRSKAHGG